MSENQFDKIKEKDEILLSVYRKSILPYYSQLILGLICGLGSIILTSFFPDLAYAAWIFGIGFTLMAYFILRAWYCWNKSLFFITNLRVIALTQEGIFSQKKEESYLEDICQTAAKVKGFRQSIFHYGRVLVQTEAELWLEDIERPHEVNDAIFDAVRKHVHQHTNTLPNKFWKMKDKK